MTAAVNIGYPVKKDATMRLPTQIFPDHHRHCDDLFIAAEQAVQRRDWDAAAARFADFHTQMETHFAAEEDVLFPAFEAATGMNAGPTQMMRYEHEQMRGLLAQLEEACAARDDESYAGVAETLLVLMQQHNMKEENILYPMCDEALGAQAERVCGDVERLLQGHA